MTNPNEPANPCRVLSDVPVMGEYFEYFEGLTKRELFAAMAMQGFLASSDLGVLATHDLAIMSVENADELIKALNKR